MNLMKVSTWASAVLVLVTLVFSQASVAQQKIGLVDVQRALSSVAAGKKVRTDIESERDKRSGEFKKKGEDIEKMRQDIEKKQAVLSEEAMRKRQAEFQEEVMKYRASFEKANQEFIKKEQDMMKPVTDKLRKVIDKVAKAKGLNVVIHFEAALFSDGSADVTDDVIKAFESEK
jgi:outer membrane protein